MSQENSKSDFPIHDNWRLDLTLFLAFLKIASITVGGGYAILGAARAEFVDRRKWLTEEDFSQLMTIIITVPGLLAINSAIYLGWNGWARWSTCGMRRRFRRG
jgi:chromate transport protein ChrA